MHGFGEQSFFENPFDDEIQNYAVTLFFSIRQTYLCEWDSDWKNDAFLGKLCGLTWRYDDEYDCYKRALNKTQDAPESLLLLLAGCHNTPDGTMNISDAETEHFLRQAIQKKQTSEAALLMRTLYRKKGDTLQETYWDKAYHELSKKNIHTDEIVPQIFN